MRRIAAVLLLLVAAGGAQAGESARLQARPLYVEDFERTPLGKLPPGVLDNSGWTGSTVPMAVVDSGDRRYGKVVECRVSGYCQIVLGQVALKQGRLYRVTADIASRGAQTVTLILRHGPSPYTIYVSSIEKTNEEMHRFSFVGRAVNSADPVLLMLLMNGHTTLQIDNIRIEEVTGALPAGAPPVPGNRLFNAGFEVLDDGWFLRGRHEFTEAADAFEGRRALKLQAPAHVSSSWLPLSMEADYLVTARLKCLDEQATVSVSLSNWQFPRGGNAKTESYTVTRAEGWKTVGFRWRPLPPAGKVTRLAEYYFQVSCESPQDATVLVDGLEVKADLPGASSEGYRPRAPLELAIRTGAPYNVATVGEKVAVTVLATSDTNRALLQVRDEADRLFRSVPVRFQGREARTTLVLPSGYWRLVTRPSGKAEGERVEAETFLAVAPRMPDVPLRDWLCGTHIPDTPALRKACWKLGLRWDRLHDTAVWSKWPWVEPDRGEWTFNDEAAARHRARGHGIVGLLDTLPQWAQTPLTGAEQKARLWLRPETVPAWEEYARRAAEHWRGVVDTWEVMNEPYFSVSAVVDQYAGRRLELPVPQAVGAPLALVVTAQVEHLDAGALPLGDVDLAPVDEDPVRVLHLPVAGAVSPPLALEGAGRVVDLHVGAVGAVTGVGDVDLIPIHEDAARPLELIVAGAEGSPGALQDPRGAVDLHHVVYIPEGDVDLTAILLGGVGGDGGAPLPLVGAVELKDRYLAPDADGVR